MSVSSRLARSAAMPVLIVSMILGACASDGVNVARLKADPPKSDKRIVPGWRVEQVYLGMPAAELIKVLGAPENHSPSTATSGIYEWHKRSWSGGVGRTLRVAVSEETARTITFKADSLFASRLHYDDPKTPEGICVGCTLEEFTALSGKSETDLRPSPSKAPGDLLYCDRSGVSYFITEGRVFSITVSEEGSPGPCS